MSNIVIVQLGNNIVLLYPNFVHEKSGQQISGQNFLHYNRRNEREKPDLIAQIINLYRNYVDK